MVQLVSLIDLQQFDVYKLQLLFSLFLSSKFVPCHMNYKTIKTVSCSTMESAERDNLILYLKIYLQVYKLANSARQPGSASAEANAALKIIHRLLDISAASQ